MQAMISIVVGGFFSLLVSSFLAGALGASGMSGATEMVLLNIAMILPGMLIGGIWSIKKSQDELKSELAALRDTLAQTKEKKEETE